MTVCLLSDRHRSDGVAFILQRPDSYVQQIEVLEVIDSLHVSVAAPA
jgi:hypothetical protein